MVNFTGIKNVSYAETGSVTGGKNPKRKPLSHTQYMNFELTNDNNDDLDEFLIRAEKEYENPINPGVVGLQISGDNIYLNDKKLEIKAENIPLIQFITDIAKRIKTSDKKFDLDQNFIDNEALSITPLFKETRKLEEFVQCPWADEFVHNAHYPFIYKDGAKKVVDSVTDIMTDYFDR